MLVDPKLLELYPDCPNALAVLEVGGAMGMIETLRRLSNRPGVTVAQIITLLEAAPLAPLSTDPASEELRCLHAAVKNKEYRTPGFRKYLMAKLYGAM